MKTCHVLISKHTFVYIKITITKAKISVLLFNVLNLRMHPSPPLNATLDRIRHHTTFVEDSDCPSYLPLLDKFSKQVVE